MRTKNKMQTSDEASEVKNKIALWALGISILALLISGISATYNILRYNEDYAPAKIKIDYNYDNFPTQVQFDPREELNFSLDLENTGSFPAYVEDITINGTERPIFAKNFNKQNNFFVKPHSTEHINVTLWPTAQVGVFPIKVVVHYNDNKTSESGIINTEWG